jgi:hypothetical protein
MALNVVGGTVQHLGMRGITYAQSISDMSVYLAAHKKATKEGKSDDQAMDIAYRNVAETQGSNDAGDRNAIQRNQALNLISLFSTVPFAQWNQVGVAAHNFGMHKDVGSTLHLARVTFQVMIVPAIIMSLLNTIRGADLGPDDDEDPYMYSLKFLAKSTVGTLPIIAPLINSLMDRNAQNIAIVRPFAAGASLAHQMIKDFEEGTWDPSKNDKVTNMKTARLIGQFAQLITVGGVGSLPYGEFMNIVSGFVNEKDQETWKRLRTALLGNPPVNK